MLPNRYYSFSSIQAALFIMVLLGLVVTFITRGNLPIWSEWHQILR